MADIVYLICLYSFNMPNTSMCFTKEHLFRLPHQLRTTEYQFSKVCIKLSLFLFLFLREQTTVQAKVPYRQVQVLRFAKLVILCSHIASFDSAHLYLHVYEPCLKPSQFILLSRTKRFSYRCVHVNCAKIGETCFRVPYFPGAAYSLEYYLSFSTKYVSTFHITCLFQIKPSMQ